MPEKINITKYYETANTNIYRTAYVLYAEEIRQILMIGRNQCYNLLKSEECPFPVIRIATHTIRIPTNQFFAWLDDGKTDLPSENNFSHTDYRSRSVLYACDVQEILRIGNGQCYKLLSPEKCPFPTLRISKHTIRIPSDAFFNWLDHKTVNDKNLVS